jgi:acetolactate synthase-1/2/3 large subunit
MKKKYSGAEILMECIIRSNSEFVFGYPGGAIMPIYDALSKYKKINHVLTAHEQGAVFAAEGYARIKKKPGICFATSGPGATNLITGIADAMLDSVPIICVTGQVSTKMLGTEAFQEVPFVEMVKPITKYAVQISSVRDIVTAFKKAYKISLSGRPGPVVIDIPKDIQCDEVFEDFKNFSVKESSSEVFINLGNIYQMLNNYNKVLVLVGNGIRISKTEKFLKRFLKKTNYMFVSTLHGLVNFNNLKENNLGMIGMHGRYAGNIAVGEAEVIIALGMRFDDRVTGELDKFAKQAKIIHVDIDKNQIGKKVNVDIGIHVGLEVFFENLDLKKLNRKKMWNNFKEKYENFEERKLKKRSTKKLSMQSVMDVINKNFTEDKIVVSDVGQHQMVVARKIDLNENDIFFSSGGLGSMGFSLPGAIGASFASKEKNVLSISGDGGFQMNIQELATIMRNNLNIKIFIFNNSYLGMVRQWQTLFYKNNLSQVDLLNPDFVKIGESFGIKSYRVKNIREAEKLLKKISKIKKSVLVEFVCEKEENVFPMVPAGNGISEMVFE